MTSCGVSAAVSYCAATWFQSDATQIIPATQCCNCGGGRASDTIRTANAPGAQLGEGVDHSLGDHSGTTFKSDQFPLADPDPTMNNPCRTAVDYRTSDASKWAGFYDTNDPTIWEYFDENSRIEIGSYGGIAGGNIGWCPSVFGAYEAVGAPKVFIVLIENISGSALTPVDDYLEVKYGIDSESGWPEIVMKGDWSAHYGGWRFYYTTGLENESDSELKLKLC